MVVAGGDGVYGPCGRARLEEWFHALSVERTTVQPPPCVRLLPQPNTACLCLPVKECGPAPLMKRGSHSHASRSYSFGFTLDMGCVDGTVGGAAQATHGPSVGAGVLWLATVTGKSETGCRQQISIL